MTPVEQNRLARLEERAADHALAIGQMESRLRSVEEALVTLRDQAIQAIHQARQELATLATLAGTQIVTLTPPTEE